MNSPATGPAEQAWQLARAHYQAGRLGAAEEACLSLLEDAPAHAEAFHLLGLVARQRGDFAEAERSFRAALAARPAYAAAHNNLGIALCEIGHRPEAEEHFREALRLEPAFADAHNNLGNLLQERGRSAEAERNLRSAIELRPDHAEAHANLGIVLRSLGRLREAEACARRATELQPDYAEAYNVRGVALFGLGRLQEAEQSYRKALALDPALAVAQGNLVYLMNCVSGHSLAEIYAEHREFALRFCPAADPAPHENTADLERRLRIGYVSGDFRHHSVAFFIEAVLAAHDRKGVEVFCYYNQAHADNVTERLRGLADHWREVHALDDASFAQQVRSDGIDILVDLSGYTANNRLPVFARKPAPVQATWLGYLNTTGLDAIDYRISDAHANPPGPLDRVHSERLVRMPDSQWCYLPPAESPDVGPAPCLAAGHVSFASFSIPAKLDGAAVALWGRLLERVPGSRLLVVTNGLADVPDELVARLVQQGVAPERLRVCGSKPFREYLASHGEVDIVLDTFPFTGGTTSCHALWMGAPVVSLAGESATSRGGASLLHTIGLGELVADSEETFLDVASALALDTARLAALRAGMRERMLGSPLMDAPRFARNLETAYREMWRTWCAGRPPSFAGKIAARWRRLIG